MKGRAEKRPDGRQHATTEGCMCARVGLGKSNECNRPFTPPHTVSWRTRFFNFADIVNRKKRILKIYFLEIKYNLLEVK